MSGLREGYKEPYNQQTGCIISLALIVGISAIYCNVPPAHASEATDWPPAGTPKMLVRKTLRANPGHSSL